MSFSAVRKGPLTLLATAALLCTSAVRAGTPVTYYNSANTADGVALRASLNAIVSSGAVRVGYDNTFPVLYVTDEDPANSSNVFMVYGRDSRPKADSTSISNGSPLGAWNREHVFPQSFFNSNEPMRSDLHALMPADTDTNTHRSNYPYKPVLSGATYSDLFGNKKTGGSTAVFEPANVDKGRVARAVFFMDVRYEFSPDLTVVDTYPGGTGAGQMAYLTTLLEWHRQYPPTAWERARNEKVYNRQKNANPFVDHPEWVSTVYGGTAWAMSDGDTVSVSSLPRTAGSITAGTVDIPMLSLDLGLAANQFHIGQVGLSKLGTLQDAEVTNVKLWYDVDRNGVASSVDTLLDTRTFSGGTTNFALTPSFYVAPGSGAYGTRLLVTASVPASASNGSTLQLRVNANSIAPDSSGGVDTAPSFANQDSNTVTIGSSISGGDSVTPAFTNRAPLAGVAGSADIPMTSLSLTLPANEWDLGQINIAKIGTIADAGVTAVNLYADTNSNGSVDAGEQLIATTIFSGGVGALSPSPAYRIIPGTRNFVITASLAFTAAQDSTLGIRVVANGISHSLTGGADVNPVFTDRDSGLLTVTASSGGNTNLVISEVYEGNGGNVKFLELHNLGSTSINLGDYRLRRYANGSLTVTIISLSGTLLPGGFYVISYSAASPNFDTVFGVAKRNATSGSLSHNGNDVYDLQLIASGQVVDSFGADLAGTSSDFAKDVVAFRVGEQLPNNGAWGTPTNAQQGDGSSPSGYWSTIKITADNANGTAVASPGTAGGASGAEVPVTLSGFQLD